MKRFGLRDMRIWGVTFLAGAVALSGCDGALSPKASEQQAASVPDAVQKLIDAPFAADGQVHVQSAGTFAVRADTLACSFQPDGRIYVSSFVEEMKRIEAGSDSSKGVFQTDDSDCKSKDAIFSKSFQSPNRLRKPYKLVRAVWQGDVAKGGAYWVGGVERLGDWPVKPQPNVDNMPGPGPPKKFSSTSSRDRERFYLERAINHSIVFDITAISEKFVEFVANYGDSALNGT